jgi:hypothetical protein
MITAIGRPKVAHLSPLLLALVAACGPARVSDPSGTRTGASGTARPPGSGGPQPGAAPAPAPPAPTFVLPDAGAFDAQAAARPDMTCGLQRHQLERLAPELLLVLDRSGSMNEGVEGSINSRWTETSAAVDDVLARTDGSTSWGLKTFPAPEGCDVQPEVEVPIGPRSQPVIAAVRATMPNQGASGTPTADAIQAGTRYLSGRTTRNPKYMVVATDGLPTCPQFDFAVAEQEALDALAAARTAGIDTFVIGIATLGTDADRVLGLMAAAGGRPRATTPAYHPAGDRQELVAALGQITRVVQTCTFPLDRDAPSPDDVAVNVDGMRIQRDRTRTNGWDYGPGNRVIDLYGAACETVKAGGVLNLEIVFGCPMMPIL